MGSWKREADFAAGQALANLPQLLRELADALESGGPEGLAHGLFQGLPARDWRKLVLVAERKDKGLSLKLKAKRGGEVRVPTAPRSASGPDHRSAPGPVTKAGAKSGAKAGVGREKYRQLKKAMQADFKALRSAAEAGRMPLAETLESFLGLAEGMAQGEQPVSGAPLGEMARANTAFLDDCQALRKAFSARDGGALASVLERLARRKSACHAQFRE